MDRAGRRHPNDEINLAGAQVLQPKPTHAGVGVIALVRQLNEQGVYELTNGGSVRNDYMDATELCEMIRLIVRDELERVLGEPEGFDEVIDEPYPFEDDDDFSDQFDEERAYGIDYQLGREG